MTINDFLKKSKMFYLNIKINLLKICRNFLKRDLKCIVFVTDNIKPRIAKIGYALMRRGYKVIILIDKNSLSDVQQNIYPYYNKLYRFSSEKEALYRCLKYRPLVYHIFVEANVPEYAEYLIRKKEVLGKIVYDQYDVMRGLSRLSDKACAKREKYSFQYADGICCRSFETQYLKHKYHYRFNGKRILFFDYCWGNMSVMKRRKKEEDSLQIVYGGRILPPKSNDVLGTTEWEALSFLAEELKKKKSYFYIIPSQLYSKRDMKDFNLLHKTNPYFKLQKPMRFKDLIRYESNMDYGIDCLEFQCKMEEYERLYKGITDFRGKARYYATNKFFDYLDAGIPIIYGRKGEMFGRYLARYKVAVPCALENIPEQIETLKRQRIMYAQNIIKARKELSIENQIPRLIEFYKKL